jgi:hypothetical protein
VALGLVSAQGTNALGWIRWPESFDHTTLWISKVLGALVSESLVVGAVSGAQSHWSG